jgi:Cu(I)/Ag(I) efflux system membrane fusion protein
MKGNQPQLYEAVRAKLKSWKLSDSQISDIEASGQLLEYFPIYASVTGNIAEIAVAAGDYVKRGQALFKVADLNTLWAEFDAYEAQFAKLNEGDTMTLEFRGQPTIELQGKITYISPILDNTSRTAVVRVEVPNPENKIKPGMFVQGWVSSNSEKGKKEMLIPESAVLWTGCICACQYDPTYL